MLSQRNTKRSTSFQARFLKKCCLKSNTTQCALEGTDLKPIMILYIDISAYSSLGKNCHLKCTTIQCVLEGAIIKQAWKSLHWAVLLFLCSNFYLVTEMTNSRCRSSIFFVQSFLVKISPQLSGWEYLRRVNSRN